MKRARCRNKYQNESAVRRFSGQSTRQPAYLPLRVASVFTPCHRALPLGVRTGGLSGTLQHYLSLYSKLKAKAHACFPGGPAPRGARGENRAAALTLTELTNYMYEYSVGIQ